MLFESQGKGCKRARAGLSVGAWCLVAACGVSARTVHEGSGGAGSSGGSFTAGENGGSGGVGASVAGSSGSAGMNDASSGVGDSAGASSVGLRVTISSPSETVYTNGSVSVQVVVSGGSASSVELLIDDEAYVALPPSYQYQWDTTGTPEGPHSLVARASADSQIFDSRPRSVVVDRTPPVLVKQLPTPDASNVFVDDAISAQFSEPLLPASVALGTVTLTSNGAASSVAPALSSDGRTVTLVPLSAPVVPGALVATLTTALTDLAGNALPAPATWSWQLPQWVSVGGGINAVNGQTVTNIGPPILDASGNPMVAFTESDGAHVNLYVEAWNGAAWLPIGAAINVNPGQDVGSAYLVSAGGKPTVVLLESDGVSLKLYAEAWSGTAWQALGSGVDLGGNVITITQFGYPAADAAGNIALTVLGSDGAHVNAYTVQWSGSSFQLLGSAINPVAGQDIATKVNLALNAAGQPVIAFSESDGSAARAYVQQWTGSAWQALGTASNPQPGQSVGGFVGIGLASSGKPIIGVTESDGSHKNVYALQWTGSTWSNLGSPVNPVPGQDVITSNRWFVVDSLNHPLLVVREPGAAAGHINAYVEKWSGTSWSLVGTALNPVAGQDLSAAFLSLDASDRPLITASESDGAYANLYVLRSNQ